MKTYEIIAEKLVWAKAGNRAVRKYRCSSGSRRGRVVAQAAACFSPIDIKKRLSMKKTKAKIGSKMVRKAQKTKRTNPISRRIRSMNR